MQNSYEIRVTCSKEMQNAHSEKGWPVATMQNEAGPPLTL